MRLVSLEPRAGGADSLDITTGALELSEEKTFILEINGDLKRNWQAENFLNVLLPRISIFAKDVKSDYSLFALSFVRLHYQGIPVHMENLDNMMRSVKYYIEKYLIKYDINLVVKYREGVFDAEK